MDAASIRRQLHHYLEVADERKLKAIYVMVEDDIHVDEDYPLELKKELDKRVASYLKDGKLVSQKEMNKRLEVLRKKK